MAVLNFRDKPLDEFGLYGRAFYHAGRALAEKLIMSPGYNHLDICPIVFLYRHALELYLKAIIIDGSALLKCLGNEPPARPSKLLNSHDLTILLDPIEKVFESLSTALENSYSWPSDGQDGWPTFNEFKAIVNKVAQMDSGSYTFRYPVKTDATGSLPKGFSIDIPDFNCTMDSLLECLDTVVFAFSAVQGQLSG